MRARVFVVAVTLVGCGPAPAPIGLVRSERFEAAQAVFQSACVSCHADFGHMSEDEWRATGRVVAGNAIESPVFRFLKGSAVGGPETMPREGELSAEQRERIRAWIDGLSGGEGSPLFHAARVVLANHCVACHREGTGLVGFAFASEAAWVDSGLVVAGKPDASYLVRRIAGAGLGGAAETMPFDRPPMRADELAAIRVWIASLTPRQ